MLRNYRGVIVAGLFGLALFAIWAGTESAAKWADSPSAYPNYYDSAEDTQKRFPMLSLQKAFKRPVQQQPCRDQQSRDASDLCAQWRAADAAERASRWAWWQLFLSALGVAGLCVTLWFNWQAWREAEEAQRDTRNALALAARSASAAERLADISDKAAKQQLRAYVQITRWEIVGIEGDDGPPSVVVHYKNTGKTPALKCTSYYQALEVRGGGRDTDLDTPIPPGNPSQAVVGAGVEMNDFVDFPNFLEIAPQIANGIAVAFVIGWVRYEDIFGEKHITNFRVFCDRGSIQRRGFAIAPKGNDAD